MAALGLLWVCRLERNLLPRHRIHAFSTTVFPANYTNACRHEVDSIPTDPLPPSHRRYDADKMARLFANVRRADDEEEIEGGLLDAELSGVASPLAGMCWHRSALSNLVAVDGGSSQSHHPAGTDGGGDRFTGADSTRTFVSDADHANPNCDDAARERDAILRELQLLMENDRREKERVRAMVARDRKLQIGPPKKGTRVEINREVSTMKLLSIASDISGRAPAQRKPQLDERRARREQAYYRSVSRLDGVTPPEADRFYRSKRMGGTELIRVLDVDVLPLPLLHHMLCYILVKHMPAESVLKVVSRVAVLRDKSSDVGYQNLLRDVAKLASPLCRAEVVALLSRCYQSISVPFMVDYVRRFGTFSRRFMAKLVQSAAQPMPLDFMRYRAGQRAVNQLLTRPWALFGYVKLLKRSSAKTYMYHNLLVRGYVPNESVFDGFHAFGTLDARMAATILNSEKLLNATADFGKDTPWRSEVARPTIYDEVLEAQALGLPLDEVHEEGTTIVVDGDGSTGPTGSTSFTGPDAAHCQSPTLLSTQMVKIQGDLPGSQRPAAAAGFRDVADDLPVSRSHISWSTPWGRSRDAFHFRGKTYAISDQRGWRMLKGAVRPHYLKNVQMNKRKRQRKAMRRAAAKLARTTLAAGTL